jgi:hypothetical protein
MPTYILTTPVPVGTPGQAAWTDASTVPTAPSGPAGGDLDGTYPDPSVVGFNGIPIDTGAPANGNVFAYNSLTNTWEHSPVIGGGGPPTGPAGGDLGGLYPNPGVTGLQTDPLPVAVADGFLKRDAANTGWEEVPYGSAANTVCEGDDPRLSDARTPTGAAGGDLSGNYPNPTVSGLQTRPVDPTAPALGDSLIWDGLQWTHQNPAYALAALYGAFSSTADQPLAQNVPWVVQYTTTDGANGTTLQTGINGPTELKVLLPGVYEVTASLQMLNTGGGGATITFWLRLNGVNVPNTASSIEMGNNNNRTLPFVPIILPLAANDYIEWVILSTGANTSIEHFNAVVGPPAVPAIPSVIASIKRIGA